MTIDPSWLQLMSDTVQIELFYGDDHTAAFDPYGKPMTVAAVGYQCEIQYMSKRVLNKDGEYVVSDTQIILGTYLPREANILLSRVTLPGGQQPPILHYATYSDPINGGPHHTELFL